VSGSCAPVTFDVFDVGTTLAQRIAEQLTSALPAKYHHTLSGELQFAQRIEQSLAVEIRLRGDHLAHAEFFQLGGGSRPQHGHAHAGRQAACLCDALHRQARRVRAGEYRQVELRQPLQYRRSRNIR
jgi:hypothetical protein